MGLPAGVGCGCFGGEPRLPRTRWLVSLPAAAVAITRVVDSKDSTPASAGGSPTPSTASRAGRSGGCARRGRTAGRGRGRVLRDRRHGDGHGSGDEERDEPTGPWQPEFPSPKHPHPTPAARPTLRPVADPAGGTPGVLGPCRRGSFGPSSVHVPLLRSLQGGRHGELDAVREVWRVRLGHRDRRGRATVRGANAHTSLRSWTCTASSAASTTSASRVIRAVMIHRPARMPRSLSPMSRTTVGGRPLEASPSARRSARRPSRAIGMSRRRQMLAHPPDLYRMSHRSCPPSESFVQRTPGHPTKA